MWSGASGEIFPISFFVAASTLTDAENFSPPCTTRCPMASSSFRVLITPASASVSTAITCRMASTWSFISTSRTTFPLPVLV